MKTILVVDDERGTRESVRMILKDSYDVRIVSSGQEALDALGGDAVDLVILDLLMPTVDGLSVLTEIKKRSRAAVVILTAIKKLKVAIEAMKLGAADYLVKPFDPEELQLIVQRIIKSRLKDDELDYLRQEIAKNFPIEKIVAESQAMKEILQQVRRLTAATSTVLVTGESGTGKELIARAVHRYSMRSHMPFITVHSAAIPEGILESELFGHEKGAFTGAIRSRRGMFELADGGTLFLDEISEMSLSLQAKILRALQEKEFTKVGGEKSMKVDVRLIAASNRDLRELVREGRFREDLFFRLSVIPIHIPPLREREQDIQPLAEYSLGQFCLELHCPPKELSPDALAVLKNYTWPGNVRELRNVLERSVAMHRETQILLPGHFSLDWSEKTVSAAIPLQEEDGVSQFEKAEQELNRRLILDALEKTGWNQTEAANKLKITRRRLKYRMDTLGIVPKLGRGRPRILHHPL
ncbi:MAG: sigma-54 dependent transcriptional regulator [Candidatus Aureabacteria bacterium]|nr:sigma-54 dependent transcriptional regulator [Candidatus Auribacterota bacterium]